MRDENDVPGNPGNQGAMIRGRARQDENIPRELVSLREEIGPRGQ